MLQKMLSFLLVFVFSQPVFSATSCLVHGDIELSIAGKTVKAPQALEDCAVGLISKGTGSVFFENSKGKRQASKVKQGDKLADIVRGASVSNSFGDFLSLVRAITEDHPTISAGVKRASSDEGFAGFPSAEIYVNDQPIEMNFSKSPMSLTNFEIVDNESNRVVFSIKGVHDRFIVPKGTLRAGREYHWRADSADGNIGGDFRVTDPESAKGIAHEMSQALAEKFLTDSEQRILKALVFEQYGLTFDRDRVVSKLPK